MSDTPNKQPDVASLRENYSRAELDVQSLNDSPFVQFSEWMSEAIEAALPEPNALTLATVSATGFPSARVVLLKGVSEAGFTFYTNYKSRKGRELAENPQAAMVFLWKELERQVRIEGLVAKISPEESDAYFNSRPLGSRLGAIASPQSEVIADRSGLKAKMAELETLSEAEVNRPRHWGGYRLAPLAIEFWQGRPSRLHDRFRFERNGLDQPWRVNRLAP